MPRSAAQIEASRRNGARSRGPQTQDGRARASANARRHGLCARTVVLDDAAEQAEFDLLLAGLRAAYRPIDAQEQELVRILALASWQLRRAHALELRHWQEQSRQADDPGPSLETILRYQARAESARARAMRELKLYRSGQLHRGAPDPAGGTNEPERPRPDPRKPAGDAITGRSQPGNGARAYQHLMERYVQTNPVTVLEALIRTAPAPD